MAPPAVFLLPFLQLYSSIGLFDTPLAVAHCLFTVPLLLGRPPLLRRLLRRS